MKYGTVKQEARDRAAYITLNRPDALNAISRELLLDLKEALEETRMDESLKTVVVTGEGRAFSAGADLKFVVGIFDNPVSFRDYLTLFNETISALENFPLPVIAAVNGFCFAGGIEMMLACDLAIVAEDARIGDQHMNFGLIGGPVFWQLLKRLGWQKSLELIVTGRWLTGKEAESYGLVLKAVPREKLMEEVEAILSQLRDKSRPGLVASKKALRLAREIPSREEAVEAVCQVTYQYITTEKEPREGVKAFLEKRAPKF